MKLYVGVTDFDWFQLHASKPYVDEVNFWKPSENSIFKVLDIGGLFLFKLHAPRNYIAGGGFFTRFLKLPVSLAWSAFGEGNGARSLGEVRERISHYRHTPIRPLEDPTIGCIILNEPFFWEERDWIKSPDDFKLNTVQGKGYEIASATGSWLWREVSERLQHLKVPAGPAAQAVAEPSIRYGKPILVKPRLGQGSFRVLVTDEYKRCAMTREKTLPVLEAAHIRPFAQQGAHDLTNGLLLRSDVHTLFDRGYITVDPDDLRIVVSDRIKEEFDNGRHYYELAGTPIVLPENPENRPSHGNLLYHATNVFR